MNDMANYVILVEELAEALHAEGMLLTAATPAGGLIIFSDISLNER